MVIDILFIIVVAIIILLNILFRSVVKTTKNIQNKANLSGFEVARKLSSVLCAEEPHIIKKNIKYLDHYNRERNVIKLSPEVFDCNNIYAAITASNVALETNTNKKNIINFKKINSYFVILSYIFIILAAFTNNIFLMRLGLIIFILAFTIEFVLLAILFNQDEINNIYQIIKEEKIIKPSKAYEENYLLLALVKLATFPYSFIIYFK